jgi:hypothetical protein
MSYDQYEQVEKFIKEKEERLAKGLINDTDVFEMLSLLSSMSFDVLKRETSNHAERALFEKYFGADK